MPRWSKWKASKKAGTSEFDIWPYHHRCHHIGIPTPSYPTNTLLWLPLLQRQRSITTWQSIPLPSIVPPPCNQDSLTITYICRKSYWFQAAHTMPIHTCACVCCAFAVKHYAWNVTSCDRNGCITTLQSRENRLMSNEGSPWAWTCLLSRLFPYVSAYALSFSCFAVING